MTVALFPAAGLEATPAQLVWAPGQWQEGRAVAVRAVDNRARQGDRELLVGHEAASTDAMYHGTGAFLPTAQLAVRVVDDEGDCGGSWCRPGSFVAQSGLCQEW